MRVLKFGGTSVANAERFLNVADIAANTAKQTETALVLSAPAKITNLLVSLVKSAVSGKDGQEEFTAIRNIIEPLIASLKKEYPELNQDFLLNEFNTNILTQTSVPSGR